MLFLNYQQQGILSRSQTKMQPLANYRSEKLPG